MFEAKLPFVSACRHGSNSLVAACYADHEPVAGAGKERQVALDEFYKEWKDDSLVILKWLGLQTGSNISGNLQNVQQLLKHPAVNITNPNTCYSVFLGFARSPVNFHAQDGSGYKFMADSTLQVI